MRGWDGKTDWVPGRLSGLLAVTENTQRSGGAHTHTEAHPAWCPLSCQVSASLTASALATLPKRASDFIYLFVCLFFNKLKEAKCGVCTIRIQQELDWFLKGMLIRRMLPTQQFVAAHDRNRL